MIEVSNLTFAYGGENVLENISFQVKEKDFVALIGPNGSGKTTVINAILGKLKSKRGSIKLFGKKSQEFRDWSRIGYVPQRFNVDSIFPGTVREILSVGQEVQVPTALGIGKILDKQFSKLSGGQQQKVLIAFALQTKPELLILDEPTVGIDAQSEHEFYEMLKNLNESGVAILFVTHDVGMIPKYFKRVVCINKTVCCQGPVEHTHKLIKEAYGQDFVMHHHH